MIPISGSSEANPLRQTDRPGVLHKILCVLAVLMLCSLSACDGRARSQRLSAESFFRDDVLLLPVSVTTWPDGKWDNCKFACRNERHMKRLLEFGCSRYDPSVKWKIEYDEEHRQTLVPYEENTGTRTEIQAYPNGAVLIAKYREDAVFSTYVAIFYDGAAILSGTFGEFAVPGEEDTTVRLLFPIHLLAEPKEFESAAFARGRVNSMNEEYLFASSSEDILGFYADSGRFEIEKAEEGFLLTGYDSLYPEYAPEVLPPMDAKVFFRIIETDGFCKVRIELLNG